MTFLSPSPVDGYISIPITVDPNVLIQNAFAAIRAQIPGWTPHEGQLDVAILEEAAQMFSTTAQIAAQQSVDIFKRFGPLVGIYPIQGTQATVPATFTMTDTAGYTIPAGTVIAYPLSGNQQVLFTLQTTLVIAPGASTGTCTLLCETVGSFPNALVAATCQMVTTFAQVSSIVTTAAISGGVDADTEASYINRLSNELQLLAPRPILASDYAAMAPNVTGVFRAMAIDGLNPGRSVTDGVLNTTITITSATAAFTSGDVGRPVTGTGIASSTVIATYISATSVTLSNAATATSSGVSLAFGDLTGQQRYVTVCGIDESGTTLSGPVNTALQTYLASKREVNFVVATINPTYTGIDVTVSCDAVHGASTGTVQSAIVASLTAFLNKATWGGGANQVPSWSNSAGTVFFLDIANVIRTTPGVLYIPSGGLTIALHGGSLLTADLTLPGDAPLPTVGTFSVAVTAT